VELPVTVQERLQILKEAAPDTWLAFSSDESQVVGRGETFSAAAYAAEKAGEQDPVIMLIPSTWSPMLL
jgi:hypothetical protein